MVPSVAEARQSLPAFPAGRGSSGLFAVFKALDRHFPAA
jgi:hypothetical protein